MPDIGKDRKQNEGMRRKTLPPALIGRGGIVQAFSNYRHIDILATLQGFRKCDANHTRKCWAYALSRDTLALARWEPPTTRQEIRK